MADKLTPQQKVAVTDRGGKLLVSAAAGSGKTKVLVDRLMGYIIDPHDPANVDDFLIITFTNAAAAELRMKIAQKISEMIAQEPNNHHLQRQMQRLYLAKISTVHAFCMDVLRENAYRLDIPVDFKILEERDGIQLQLQAIDTVLEAAYAHIHEDTQIRDFLDTQGLGRNDKQIPPILLSVYRSARCHQDPEGWLKWCEDQANAEGVSDASETVWGSYLIRQLHTTAGLHAQALENCVHAAQANGEMPAVVQLLSDMACQLKHICSLHSWEEISQYPGLNYGRLTFPKKCSDLQLCEQIKIIRKTARDDIALQLKRFSDSSDQVLLDLRTSGSSAKGLVKLVRSYAQEYERLKKYRRVLDFSDVEHKMLDLLIGKNRTGITAAAKEIGARFREIMVDEYQDSNGVQDAIYKALTDERQNCFMVGDVKQSIYQFRLADPTIFIEKYNQFVPAPQAVPGQGRKVLLSSNFRSGAGVIHAVNDVFIQSMSTQVGGLPYTEDEMLYEGMPHVAIEEPEVELYGIDVESSTLDEEAGFVAQRVVQLLDGSHMIREGDGLRPIRPSDIVILLRSPRTAGGYFQYALQCAGISCTMGGGTDILQTEEVSVLVSLLQVLVNPQQDIPLLAVMCSRVFCFCADELAKIRAKDHSRSVYDALKDSESERVCEFLETIEQLRLDAQICRLPELIGKIFKLTNYRSVYFAMEDGEMKCVNLEAFCQVASDFANGGQRDLGQFLEYLKALEETGLLLESDKKPDDCVTIMSVHTSKGLEFPVVFLCGLSRSFNKESIYQPVLCHKELGLGLNYTDTKNRVRYPTVAKSAIAASITAESVSEEMRVLYVAMTRARDRLIMTYAKYNLADNLTKICLRLEGTPRVLLTANAACPGEWIMQTALGRTEAGEFFSLTGGFSKSSVKMAPWLIRVVNGVSVETAQMNGEPQNSNLSKETIDRIGAGLRFIYPYQSATQIPSKQTATQLKGRNKDQEAAEFTKRRSAVTFRKPLFVDHKTTAAEKGSAVHAFMQYAKFDRCMDLHGIKQELERMVSGGLLTKEQANLVDLNKLLPFFLSDFGKQFSRTDCKLIREFKFSVLVDSDRYYPGVDGEKILLQGVVDCALVKPDGIVVIDFKTDWVNEEMIDQVKMRYAQQIRAYTEALEQIYKLPVLESYLYLFSIGKFVMM